MTESQKMKCPACDKLVSAQMPNCPFCTQELPVQTQTVGDLSESDTKQVASALAELEAAKEELRQSQPTFTGSVPVTGPISAFISLVKPSYGGGVIQIVEIVLAVAALPTILVGIAASMMGVKRWGRIPAFLVLFPAALVTLVAWKMEAPVGFPVLMVSLIAFSIKSVIGMIAKARQLSR